MRSDSIAELTAALSLAQGELTGAAKDSINPHFRSKYADLASIWDACRVPLSKHGLAVFQPARAEGPHVTVTTLLAHKSGEWISEDLTLTAQQDTPQGVGSAITYARRYGLAGMVGIAPEDDDGNAATKQSGYVVEAPAATTTALSERQALSAPNGVTPSRGDSEPSLPAGVVYITKVDKADREGAIKGWLHTSAQLPGSDGVGIFDDRLLGLAAECCQNRTPVRVTFKTSGTSRKDYVKDIVRDKPPLPSIDINEDMRDNRPAILTADDIPFLWLLPLLLTVSMWVT